MSLVRISTCVAALVLLLLTGCAVNRATATVDPTANLAGIKTVHVVQLEKDERGVNRLIADRLNTMGFNATTSLTKTADTDAIVTYADKWMWDITMYMIELTVVVRDPKNDFALATGNSLHTSLTRKSPVEMVDEVTANIFKGVKK
jgi:hypothetical protein